MPCPRPLLIAAALAAVVSSPAQMEEARNYFSLSSSEAVAPGGSAKVLVNTSAGVRELEFRLYRVQDAAAFWRGLDEENRFGGVARRRGRPRTWLEKYVLWRAGVRGGLRDSVRFQFSPAHRASIRQWLDGPAEPKPKGVAPGRTYASVPVLNSQQLVRSWRQAIVKKQEWDSLTVPVALSEAGLYVLEATTGAEHAYTVLNATGLALVTKSYPGRIVARAVDAGSGAPQPGLAVTFMDSRDRKDLATTRTNSDGIAELAVADPAEEGIRLIACRGRDCALASVQGWSLGLAAQRELRGLVYTDRPVYRPGHTVHYRALAMAPPGEARVEIQNPQGEPVARRNAGFSRWGTVHGELALAPDAPTGYYGVQVKSGEGTIYGGFQVEEYRKPEYEVRVTPGAKRVLQGGKAEVTVQARYYYGEPVKGAKVKYAIRKARAWIWFDPEWADEETGEGGDEAYAGGTEQLEEKEGRLNEDGTLTVEVAVGADDHDMRYVVDARVTDSAGREITGLGGFLATRGDYLLRLRPSGYVYQPGQPVSVEVRAFDFEGRAVGNLDVSVQLTESNYGDGESRRPAWKSSFAARLDAEGRGTVRFPAPDSGSYRLEGMVKGTRVTGESYLWVAGEGGWPAGETAEVKIIPDKSSYRAGDTAKLLVLAGAAGSHLWLTLEGRSVLWSKFLTTRSAAETVELPVTAAWEPNVFFEVSTIRDRKYARGSKLLKAPAARRKLNVALASGKPQYLPGETAQLSLTVTDHEGKPAQGEFSVGVVDEPIYAIQPDTTPDLMQLFHGREWNRVSTVESLSFYFMGESGKRRMLLAGTRPPGVRGQLKPAAPLQPKIRKLFPDTAYWSATVTTGEDGKAAVSFAWPDALTTWRTTARGVSTEARVGNATLRTVVRKNLMLTMAAPRFFTAGDQVTVPVIVRNYYDTAQRVDLSVDVKGGRLVEAMAQTAEAPAQGETALGAVVSAEGGKELRLLGKALNPTESDALELTLPVHPQGLKLQGAQGITADAQGRSFTFGFPPAAMPGTRQLRLQLTPSVAGAIYAGLEFLIEYPYGCTEQTMSALLPNLLVSEAVKELNLPPPVERAELRKKVEAGVERLAGFQHPDGGWGWWRGDESHPFLTAYVVMGLQMAANQGFPVRSDVFSNGRRALAQQFDEGKLDADNQAWSLYALAVTQGAGRARLDRGFEQRTRMTPFGQAVLGLALLEARDSRAAEVAAALERGVKRDAGGAWWASDHDPMFGYAADYHHEATAFALRFLTQARPESPLLPEAARWLVENRGRGSYWDSTKRTALVIFGLTKYLARRGELKPDYVATVFLNDRKVLERRFSAADAMATQPLTLTIADAELRPENRIRVELKGTGRLSLGANWDWRTLAVPTEVEGPRLRREYFVLRQERSGGKVTWSPVPLEGAARPGDLLGVRLTVDSARALDYVLIEDPIPAGTEIVAREELYEMTRGRELSRSWWSRREERDNRVSFFPSHLGKGQTAFSYLLKVTHAGRFVVPPARLEPMYTPGLVAATPQGLLEVRP